MLNKITLMGYLIDDVKRLKKDGPISAYCTIALIQKSAQRQDFCDNFLFIELEFKDNLAPVALKHLRGGSKILVEGRLVERNIILREGEVITENYVEVQFIKLLDEVSSSSSTNAFPEYVDSFKLNDENSDNEKVFDDGMDIEDEDGYRFKP